MLKIFENKVNLKVVFNSTFFNTLNFNDIKAIEIDNNRIWFLYEHELNPVDRLMFYDEEGSLISPYWEIEDIKKIEIVK